MIRNRYWNRLPSEPVLSALPEIAWRREDDLSPAASTAALMLYVALGFMAEERYEDGVITGWAAQATYDELGLATALSRSLISQGLQRLQVLGLIRPEGSHQKRCYWIIWGGTGWFKLPCQAIVAGPVIVPFKNFTLRSKPELHAMKLYLYLAAVRDNGTPYSMASYETIYAKTGILERDIRKAISVLIGCGLIASVDRKHEEGLNEYGPNKYYLKGHHKLVGST